jgi:hypothetical protein
MKLKFLSLLKKIYWKKWQDIGTFFRNLQMGPIGHSVTLNWAEKGLPETNILAYGANS